tara:strand:- start:590 stop:2857 length:2268 start_codon:yes stop_codon:yes gene_type:complete
MDEEEYDSGIYIQEEDAWSKLGYYKYGHVGNKSHSLGKRRFDSHEQHAYLKKYKKVYKIKKTDKYDFGYSQFDKIITYFLKKPECISDIEKIYNCEFSYGKRLSQYNINESGGEEFISIEGFETLCNFIENEFEFLGLKITKYTEEEIESINNENRQYVENFKKISEKERDEITLKLKRESKKIKTKIVPRGIQQDILDLNYFDKNNEGHLIIPCGVGKTILSLFLNNQIKSKKTIIGVPSLNLVGQFKNECLKFTTSKNIICIGSKYETDIEVIQKFLDRDEGFLITTYHSSKKILNLNIKFDFKIADECHHLVGEKFRKSKNEDLEITDFKKFLEIKSNKSLFMTATPKLINKYNNKVGVSMDDDIFGKTIFKKSVKWAIEEGYITDYYLEVIKNNECELDQLITNIGIYVEHKELFFSALMALKSIDNNPKLTHLLIYTNTTESSDIVEFYIKEILKKKLISISPKKIYHKSLHSKIINFNIEKEKKKFVKSEYGIISCVQIFGEGMDIPKLNGVVVAEHMESEIRIVQSLLRPHRLEEGNPEKEAFIICPFIDNNDELNNKSFNKVKQIVKNMRNSDEDISSKINLNEFKKRPEPNNPTSKLIPELVKGDAINLSILKTRLRKAKSLNSNFSEEKEEYLLCKEININKSIKNKKQYFENKKRLSFIDDPENYFKKYGLWNNWYDFLGIDTTKFIQDKEIWKKICKEYKIKNLDDYTEICLKDSRLPPDPNDFYLDYTNLGNELGLLGKRRR